ncbi:hypothetical protein [Streptomyces sp900116325]|uniref:hypothetical protein n=1 Tax=Streptomyces sp. 900116325 TaxID=3154295 RepID=UPI0033BFAF36
MGGQSRRGTGSDRADPGRRHNLFHRPQTRVRAVADRAQRTGLALEGILNRQGPGLLGVLAAAAPTLTEAMKTVRAKPS